MQLRVPGACRPVCAHQASRGRAFVDLLAHAHVGAQFSHSAAGVAASRRGSLVCTAAKRPNAKKKAVQKGKSKAAVKDRSQVPDAAPVQGSSSTQQRSEQKADEQAQQRQQQQQHEQSQQVDARADADKWLDPELAEPLAQPPSAPGSADYARRQEQALSELREPGENAAELRQLMHQQQQAQQKPNFLQGVLQEVQLIEWPSISSVLLNTVLVFTIVAGFSVLLFAVNSLLAETSQALYGGLQHRSRSAANPESTAPQLPVETAPQVASQPKPPAAAPQPPTKTFQDLGPE